jgi:hypothetical protein
MVLLEAIRAQKRNFMTMCVNVNAFTSVVDLSTGNNNLWWLSSKWPAPLLKYKIINKKKKKRK